MIEYNRRKFLETLALGAVGMAMPSCNNSNSNQGIEQKVTTPISHNHKSQIYTAGMATQEQALEFEAKGWSSLSIPDTTKPQYLKDHMNEWTIIQKGYATGDSIAERVVLPFVDGNAKTDKLYQPLALVREGNTTANVPRLMSDKRSPNYIMTLDDIPVYSNIDDAIKDIKRVERRFENGRIALKGDAPNITLEAVQITSELLKRYGIMK